MTPDSTAAPTPAPTPAPAPTPTAPAATTASTADHGGDLLVRREAGVVHLVINRPDKRNALNGAVLTGMLDALRGLQDDDRVVVVSSVGDRVFCAGADLAVMSNDATGLEQHEARGGVRLVLDAMRAAPVPVVVVVQGLCLAGGVGIVLGADIVLASDAAGFGLPEVDLGLWPFMVSALLARHTSPKVAMELMLSARRIGADEALRAGLVSRVVPAEGLAAETAALTAALAAKPPVAVRLGKAAFGAVTEMTAATALEAMQAQLSLLTQTADAAEGVAAFFAKRPPQWSGR